MLHHLLLAMEKRLRHHISCQQQNLHRSKHHPLLILTYTFLKLIQHHQQKNFGQEKAIYGQMIQITLEKEFAPGFYFMPYPALPLHVMLPHMEQQQAAHPHMEELQAVQSDVEEPEAAQPHVEELQAVQPDVEEPEAAQLKAEEQEKDLCGRIECYFRLLLWLL